MPKPAKYATEGERKEAQRLQKKLSAQKKRREKAGLDEFAPLYSTHGGERSSKAKLTQEQAEYYRRLRREQGYTLQTLAKMAGISIRAMSNLVRGISYKK